MTTHGAPPNAVQNTKNTDVSYGAQQPAPKSFIPGVVHDDKYRAVPRPKTPIKDNEIRVASDGLVPRYVTYAARLFMEQEMKSITIKATGNAIPLAISVAEIVKRRFSNLHQLNVIGTTTISDVFEPVNGGLEGGVVHERDVPFIELTLTTNTELLDTAAAGYQKPIDQSLVKQMVAEDIIASRSRKTSVLRISCRWCLQSHVAHFLLREGGPWRFSRRTRTAAH